MFVGVSTGIVFVAAEWNWQVVLYAILFSAVLIGTWTILFIKVDKKIKITYIFLFALFMCAPNMLPTVEKAFDKDSCLDTGVCKEGLEINTEYGKIKINKENCLKYGFAWDEKRKWCDVRKSQNSL
ncbi:hypothetical protein tpqmel_0762 [Candidatus Gastranaerophilus sp. (ex Termes propinquus)]|nr:hypothetical protein tpqmel_0762 [Candidatus Gastranaerophilus sp. (ex Termes propinquus)]